MARIIINGVPGLDGEYPLDLTFKYRDFHMLKQIANVRANEVSEALAARDTDLVIALAAISMKRAGKMFDIEALWDAPIDSITLEGDVEDVPTQPAESGNSESNSPESIPSGTSTNESTESSQETSHPSSSGTPRPVSSSAPATLGT